MSIVLWVVAGAALGWISHSFLNMNTKRSPLTVMLIGAVGGFAGGKLLAPMLLAPASNPDAISLGALGLAVLVAAALIFTGDYLAQRLS